MAQWIVDHVPTWNIIRISGIAAYLLLFAGVFWESPKGCLPPKANPKPPCTSGIPGRPGLPLDLVSCTH